MKFSYCNHCKELSVKTKAYTRKSDKVRTRVMYCINKGCGYKQPLPFNN